MKRYRILRIGVLVALSTAALVLLVAKGKRRIKREVANPPMAATPNAKPSTPIVDTVVAQSPMVLDRTQVIETVRSIYSAPIAFYGKAQDQYGEPIAGARVQYAVMDKFWEPGEKYEGVTEVNGDFFISGITGAALTVQVSKEGYDRIYNKSDGAFAFGVPYDSQRDRPTPSKGKPAIFVLRKKGRAEKLLRVRSRQYNLDKNGVPTEVNLETGEPVAVGRGHFRVECWVDANIKDVDGAFDWRCRVSVPGGGLSSRNPVNDFEAPENGYRASEVIAMAGDKPDRQWSSQVGRDYFVKLGDGRYARMKITIFVGMRTFFVLESYLNLSGSRNLEYSPDGQASGR